MSVGTQNNKQGVVVKIDTNAPQNFARTTKIVTAVDADAGGDNTLKLLQMAGREASLIGSTLATQLTAPLVKTALPVPSNSKQAQRLASSALSNVVSDFMYVVNRELREVENFINQGKLSEAADKLLAVIATLRDLPSVVINSASNVIVGLMGYIFGASPIVQQVYGYATIKNYENISLLGLLTTEEAGVGGNVEQAQQGGARE